MRACAQCGEYIPIGTAFVINVTYPGNSYHWSCYTTTFHEDPNTSEEAEIMLEFSQLDERNEWREPREVDGEADMRERIEAEGEYREQQMADAMERHLMREEP